MRRKNLINSMVLGFVGALIFTMVVGSMARSGNGTYIEERLFEVESRSYLITIKATSPEALHRGIEKRGHDWQVVKFYENADAKDGFKYQAHLVASPSH